MDLEVSADRRQTLAGLAVLAAAAALPGRAGAIDMQYVLGPKSRVPLTRLSPPRFAVEADVASAPSLQMAESYPAELPAMAKGGWPALVSNLMVTGPAGEAVAAAPDGARGWRLANPPAGRLSVRYDIDLGIFAKAGWSSPLESVVADDDNLAVCGRALFVTSPASEYMPVVEFILPAPWQAVTPWLISDGVHLFAQTLEDLTDNMLVFTRTPPVIVKSRFRLQIAAMGHWAPLKPLIVKALTSIIQREVYLMGDRGGTAYNVVLIPTEDQGGEAYRQSFAYCFPSPSAENLPQWANTLAHEIFHYWNYARLKGADYASTQWFQEGFTEYVANITLLQGRVAGPEVFLGKLSGHVANAARLTTTMENIGTHKGPPLYSAGALVAFSFDVMIRQASGGKASLMTFFRGLWQRMEFGAKPYAWADIHACLEAAAPGDWQGFYEAHIKGSQPLPLGQVLATVGLKLTGETVVLDPDAPKAAKALWHGLERG